ncbi:pentatricopeptide repeat-containing protein At4g39952, mitochondrial [Juglans microcarpa x Juglans regia]|uniref:pentatricopeptide repeat-containing protein At4g39952, mitochondrial n=1 Tax=Juglans microcarpa x Juglans regia TaxID=2249226 RepID=UPI001B7F727D|nr:pentatricopeptide repeat-containing protein At4g39952, mitochondrial [Juglans microcarpa x Juglans regia]
MLGLRLKPTHLYKRLPSSLVFSTTSTSNYLNCRLNFFLSQQTSTLRFLLQAHNLVITSGNSNNLFIASKLISLYASLNEPISSTKVFDSLCSKDTFLWNSVIKSQFSNGNYSQALDFYLQMRVSDTPLDQFTIPMVVSTCAELMLLYHGKNIHGLALKLGLFTRNSAVGSSFVYMYSKCARMEDAWSMFDEICVRDVVGWTALVIGYVQNGESEKGLECLCEMHRIGGDGEGPTFRTLEGGFQACRKLDAIVEGRCLHSLAVKTGIGCSQVVRSSLLSMYSNCGNPEEAYLSFCEEMDKDLLSWTLIIGIYSRFGLMTECLSLFLKMQENDICPDGILISSVLLGFSNSTNVFEGKAFHGLIIRQHYGLDEKVHNALLSMYCKWGQFTLAKKLFGRVPEPNRDCWNTMIFHYGKMGLEARCTELFKEMQYHGIQPDSNSFVSVVSSCSNTGATYLGLSLHCYIIKCSLDENRLVTNSLIDMYGRSGNLNIAWKIFCRTQRDIITWNTLISSYAHSGHYAEAVALFDKMTSENVKPDSATLVTIILSCSHLASLEKGESIHRYIEEREIEFNICLATTLVDMYVKCGQLEKARKLFNSMKERDVISWNVMISGYGMHGYAKYAIDIFQEMENSNVKPNGLTFLALLSACVHGGLVEEGKCLFDRMQDYSIKASMKHYACMVDLLGRSGNLREAETLVLSMPFSPDGEVWGTLLSSCKTHNEIEIGIRIAKHAIETDPTNDGYYIMMSNLYSSVGRWEEAERVREMMNERNVLKKAGWSTL